MKRRITGRHSVYGVVMVNAILCAAMVLAIVFVSLPFSGCATGKGVDEIRSESHAASESPVAEEGAENRPNVDMITSQEDQVPPDSPEQKPRTSPAFKTKDIKPPPQLKPLLAVMNGKARPRKHDKAPEPSVHVELAFDNADIYEVLDVTLFELFKINYMVDPSIKANVTFRVSGDFTRTKFINVLNNVLQLNNLSIVEGPGEIFKVVRREASAGSVTAVLPAELVDQPGDVTQMVRLRYLAAATAANNIKPFLSKNASVVQDTVTNSLVITDTADNVDKAMNILAMMDVEYFTDISWCVFPVKEADAVDMAKDLKGVLKTGGLYTRQGMDSEGFEITPIKTINALLVVTRWPSILKLVEDWIAAMDHADNSGINVFVYFVENGTAVELADILRQLYGGSASASKEKTSIIKPTARPSGTGLARDLSGEVEIIPDETNNAIVFRATGRDYKLISGILKKLDTVPRQVLINVVIAEITLSGSLEYGIEWFLKDRAQSGYKIQGALDNGTEKVINQALGTGPTGLSIGLFDSVDFLRGLITALGEEGEINILSSPNVLAVDNKESVIEVGEQVPIPTGETTTAVGTVSSIEYRDTGVLLTVTPHINSGGLVKIDLSQEVSELGTKDPDLKAYSFLNRKAKTAIVIENGQTIFLGGLMRSKLDTSGSGIPYLRDIPFLGYLFGGRQQKVDKTELIFLITPRTISTRAEADAITKEFSQRVEYVKEIIKKKD
ncbi:putative General secretion pathway protein D [uncultured Desulfobacterium sp.]|uniref:Putative General secretion pathway protein D n=1 Tax=uncultured Desulfobacterium sp. TaxID=201089 RepID=A0A445MVQ4_9BACT|nr:putative General secretion pathway protein D [uncultured Desulfobacterium sp.]